MDLALFDFDGTMTHGDTYTPFMHFVSSPDQVRQARRMLWPWAIGYKLGLVPGPAIRRRVTHAVLAGRAMADIHAAGERYARDVLPTCLRPNAVERIAWHRTRGDRVVVVSASLDVYLHPWCRQHGLALICAELETRDGHLTGRYVEGDCTGGV